VTVSRRVHAGVGCPEGRIGSPAGVVTLVMVAVPGACVVITTVTPPALRVALTDAMSAASLDGVAQTPIGFGGSFAVTRAPALTQTGA
jgi:hypothetical protein